jgi:putative spermidine/putrescine transport system permease protein
MAPFVVFCVLFELIPVLVLLAGSIGGLASPTPDFLLRVVQHPIYRQSVINSFVVSGLSALIGAVAGTAIGYAIVATHHERLRNGLVALANVTSNAGGISLAFAYITVLGSTGAITIALRLIGIDLYSFFSLYSMAGLVIVYIYFQVPLMVVLMLPAFSALRREWSEASMTLGGTPRDFWRRVGIPVLLPAIVSGTILMFASGMGAYATAVALIAQANLMTVQISILRQGEVIFNPSQADAMATLLLVFVAVAVVLHSLLQRRTQRWAAR